MSILMTHAGSSRHRPNEASLSQMALSLMTSLEGVSSVLVGMRRPEYVADSFGAMELDAVDSRAILTCFRSLTSRNPPETTP